MSYRGPDRNRIQQQRAAAIDTHAGYSALWRQYVSASTGAGFAGRGDTYHYREQWVTAHFYGVPGAPSTISERQRAAGLVTEGKFFVSTPVKLSARDELVWMGDTYRIEGTSIPSQIDGYYNVQIKRGDDG